MTYRDIVLTLLKTRGDLVCLEKHLLSDFSEGNSTGENFSNWCLTNGIEFEKIKEEEPSKIFLKKKYAYEEN